MSWMYICLGLAIGYALLILIYWLGWLMIRPFHLAQTVAEKKAQNFFSILVPARNEEEQIEACLQAILSQEYPIQNIELIVINDHSTDRTEEVVRAFALSNPEANIRLFNSVENGFSGKKAGITFGIEQAKNPYIVLTDADCTRGSLWLKTIDAFLCKNPAKMVYAPVFFSAETLFEKFQSLEFAGLVGIGGAAIQLKNPNMCSAANLIFTKRVFLELGGYQDNQHLASGDDEFLLHKIFKHYPNEVFFLKSREAIVYTSPNASVEQLTQQRRRWVSKSTKYEERYITAILVGAYFFNLSIVFNALAGFWVQEFWTICLLQLFIKMFAEGTLLFSILRFFRKSTLIMWLPLVEPFHLFYVIVIGIWANINTYTWKERELS